MRRRDRRDHGHLRADLRGQRGDLAGMVHAHLENAVAAARRHAREAERHADVVVVAADRTMRLAAAGAVERGEDRFLDPGLADRSGDADAHRGRTGARGGGERRQRRIGVADQDVRPVDRPVDHCGRCAVGERLVEKAVPVRRFALEREEQVARTHVARVDLDPGDLKCGTGYAAHRVGERSRVPQRQAEAVARADRPGPQGAVRAHAWPPCAAAHSRATVTSSNGNTRIVSPEPTIWPCS